MFGWRKLTESLNELKTMLAANLQESHDKQNTLEGIRAGCGRLEEEIREGHSRLEEEIREGHSRLEEESGRLQSLEGALTKLQTEIKHHNMSIEDMLESWEEFQQQQAEWSEKHSLQEQLVRLCMAYERQWQSICRIALDDPAWEKQLTLAEAQLQPARIEAGFTVTGKEGEKADYDLHEVISVQETDKPDQNGLIEKVYEPGFCWQGAVLKKAKVSAYRFRRTDTGTSL